MPLTIKVPGVDLFDERTMTFITVAPTTLHLEHSLISLSKWEIKWHKPFLVREERTDEETIDYIRCMTLDPHIDDNVYLALTKSNYEEINKYISDPMTATKITKDKNERVSRRIITNEVIYYWMCELNIPPDYAKWHLNRLLTLIEVASIEKAPEKKMSRREAVSRTKRINDARRAQLKAAKGARNDTT